MVNGLHAGLISHKSNLQNLKQNERPVDEFAAETFSIHTHHSQQHPPSSPSYRKYNTIFYKRTKRTEHLLSYKEQRIGRVCTANMVPPNQGFMNIWNRWVSSETEHFGSRKERLDCFPSEWKMVQCEPRSAQEV